MENLTLRLGIWHRGSHLSHGISKIPSQSFHENNALVCDRWLRFIAGGFGLDLIVAYLGNSFGYQFVTYIGFNTLEDLSEMVGIIVSFTHFCYI